MPSWSKAFAAQAASDLSVYEFLDQSSFPSSHRLHYLQMWLEKLCKAYLWMPDVRAEEMRTRHNVIAKVLPLLVSKHWRIARDQRPDVESIRRLCREIDLLHPQVDDNGRRQDNVEYPWMGTSGTEVPANWKFPLASRLYSNAGRALIKVAVGLTRDPRFFTG